LTATATTEKYNYFTRAQVAKYLQVNPQNITDGFSGKSKSMAELLQKNGFEMVTKPVRNVPRNASIKKLRIIEV